MGVYYCSECCERTDNDWFPMDDKGRCPDCSFESGEISEQKQEEYLNEHGIVRTSLRERQKGVFTQAQRDIIKKLEMESDDEE